MQRPLLFGGFSLAIIGCIIGITLTSINIHNWSSFYMSGLCQPTNITSNVTKIECHRQVCVDTTTTSFAPDGTMTQNPSQDCHDESYDCYSFMWEGHILIDPQERKHNITFTNSDQDYTIKIYNGVLDDINNKTSVFCYYSKDFSEMSTDELSDSPQGLIVILVLFILFCLAMTITLSFYVFKMNHRINTGVIHYSCL